MAAAAAAPPPPPARTYEDAVSSLFSTQHRGAALVSSGVDKLIFVGSPEVGVRVMEAASKTLTPVVLELGGTDISVEYSWWLLGALYAVVLVA